MASHFTCVLHTFVVKSSPLSPNLSYHQEAKKQQIYKLNVMKIYKRKRGEKTLMNNDTNDLEGSAVVLQQQSALTPNRYVL